MVSYVTTSAQIALTMASFLTITEGTVVEDFFRWLHMGTFLDYFYMFHAVIVALLLVLVLFQWIKDWRWLLFLGALIFLFVQFIL
jgi:hypothetical protein